MSVIAASIGAGLANKLISDKKGGATTKDSGGTNIAPTPFTQTGAGFAAEAGMTALSGIFQARAAERARKQQLQLMRDQGQLSVEQQKGQLQQNLLQGLAQNLSNAMMSRANARAV